MVMGCITYMLLSPSNWNYSSNEVGKIFSVTVI